jgi:hypothetical protein
MRVDIFALFLLKIGFIYSFFFPVLGIEPKAAGMLDKHSTIEPHPQLNHLDLVCLCETGSHYVTHAGIRCVAQVGLEFTFLPPPPLEC